MSVEKTKWVVVLKYRRNKKELMRARVFRSEEEEPLSNILRAVGSVVGRDEGMQSASELTLNVLRAEDMEK